MDHRKIIFNRPGFVEISQKVARRHTGDIWRVLDDVPLPDFYVKEGEHHMTQNTPSVDYSLERVDMSADPKVKQWIETIMPDIRYPLVLWLIQRPDTEVVDHWDTDSSWLNDAVPDDHNPDTKDIVRRTIFVTDWTEGQEWRFEDKVYTGWHKGSCIEWPWWTRHGTHNKSKEARINIRVTGERISQ
jgi:hypothetical protein